MFDEKAKLYVERRGRIATITINRPGQRNAISYDMWVELKRLAAAVDADDEIRVLAIRGAGGEAFSAGADIAEFDKCRNDSAQAPGYSHAFAWALDAIWELNKPGISMVQGVFVGAGAQLVF